MEKIININLQGRVIAIEETACNKLKNYVDGLRRHFANEESNEEIINDIEDRIAELLSDRLKNGKPCIDMTDLNAVIDSIGRIEDIEAEEAETKQSNNNNNNTGYTPPPVGKLYRNTDDKVIAGVCSGIAARTNMDPIIIRILFVIMFGALGWVYLLLWLILPGQSVQTNVVKRLYRNPDDKMIAGVCSGIAAYFNIEAWIVRVVFALPLIMGGISGNLFDNGLRFGPGLFAGSVGSILCITYTILWIAVPFASTSTDRMQMRGEKIDLNTIKANTQARATAAVQAARPAGAGIFRVFATIVKAFLLFIGSIVAISLFAAMVAILFAGATAMPFTSFLFDDGTQHVAAWVGVSFVLGIPMLSLIIWGVRRLMGIRTRRHYLAYMFVGLWFFGFVCLLYTASGMIHEFGTRSATEESYLISQPTMGIMHIAVNKDDTNGLLAKHDRWLGDWNDEDDKPFRLVNKNILWINNVKVNVEKSADSLYHIYGTRSSRGASQTEAKVKAEHIPFVITQQDSIIYLPNGFNITKADRFRNQRVLVTIEVPVGKRIKVSEDIDNFSWYVIGDKDGDGYYERHNSDYDYYETGIEYVMTADGLKDVTNNTLAIDND